VEEARNRVETSGVGGAQADSVMRSIVSISDFAIIKGDEFYQAALVQRSQTILRTAILSIGAMLALIGIGFYLKKSIVPPLRKITVAADAIYQGKLDTRIQYEATNEIGTLTKAFNAMADAIESETVHKDKVAEASSIMFLEDDLRPFCFELLKKLMLFTGSQVGSMYFLNEQKNRFDPFISIGAMQDKMHSFSASGQEGEFGTALATKAVQHVTDIPSDVHVIFSTVSGDYKAREIITIPIVNGTEIISIISIASIKSYSAASVRLINSLLNEISARLSSILATRQIHEFSVRLKDTNAELQQQAKELEMQTAELMEQNTELEFQKKQLDEASRLKTNFLSNMSHELRTPLNSVIALTGVLSRRLVKQIPNEEYGFLEIIERNGKNLLALINDILDISRIEAGREEIEIEQFNADDTIVDVVEMIRPQADQKSIELLYESNKAIQISSDIVKFQHILQNLIGNAVKFTENGAVTIKSEVHENKVIIKVSDTGIGIPHDQIPFIFDEFRQADGSTSRRFGGAGLGLAISNKYADMLGGTISVKSTLNVGSEFTLTLPTQLDSAASGIAQTSIHTLRDEKTKAMTHSKQHLSERKILVVEDNEPAIIQIKDLVESIGCQALIAHNAGEAFKIIEHTIPDAMILDLMMPDVDGFQVLGILRNAEKTAHVPVLILTAKHVTKDELKFLKRNNIHQLIQKGDVNARELGKAITSMLFQKKEGTERASQISKSVRGQPMVLVVEDNADNMITIKALLKDAFKVVEAVNAKESIEMATEHDPDLILMDIALPDASGIDAFRQIRTIPRLMSTPVIALTASAMRQDREVILAYGFDGFIAKPIIEADFFRIIQEVLYGE
jgi:signal transduction histidine kinase/DNA-binding response OmpR family regulator/HAMP domain-containing protein